MRRFAILIGFVFFALANIGQADARQLSVDAFARDPAISSPVISPSGTHIAFIANPDGTPRIVVGEISSGELISADISEIRPEAVRWAGDRYVLLSASVSRGSRRVHGNLDIHRTVSMDIENNLESRQLLANLGSRSARVGGGRVIGITPDDRVIMMRETALVSADPSNGHGRNYAVGIDTAVGWYLDEDSNPFARLEYSNLHDQQRIVFTGNGDRVEAVEIRNATQPHFWGLGQLPDGRFAILEYAQFSNASRNVVRAVNPETGEREDVIYSHPQFDVAGASLDPYDNQIVAIHYTGENFTHPVWLDEDLGAVHASLMSRLPEGTPPLQLLNWDEARRLFVVAFAFEDAPSAYFLYNTEDGSLTNLGARFPELEGTTLPRRRLISYAAVDGTNIPAYLTLPDTQGPHPLVVLPHGGPAARDQGGYDSLAHFLGHRGYAVLQPNFRGSAGYGHAWETAGFGQWGTGVMQTDVNDGVTALINAGLVDPNRVCIGGFSYGGYSALAGAAYTPDLYRCAFGVAGLYDIPEMLEWTQDRFGEFSWLLDYWALAVTGDEGSRRREMDRVSPRHAAEHITARILLIHGRDDTVVPVEQSRMMRAALRRNGQEPAYLELPSADHWLSRAENRIRIYQEIDAFLAENIGN
ncbi:prolyl oligopeptidase family serine peptidase [Hyphobacterium sp.]|uniref:alpha/beta hydrolase family protein n=1 Tax=Hyphobacterium sp. TaxID=2004662 RepID=UPI003BAC5BE1